ncbi:MULTISPECIES: hypothetical protein [Pseudoalteromonas]|uniref:hypothetical protein n=1 Tax=Pseudoalteromonas TaxID=53246 RepID=UPI0019D0C9C3|nr:MULTISPECIES: hypothetical protein [Pseudoalteromonas]MBR8842758.1 hypothetical protein [Pseudoalteromonas sp. JC3]UDM62094.1 hypothetical protein KIJ96_02210 [Pseudoalteromonas piscicida]WJE10230.1 hypothetical protein QSH61_07125 [Pseudoalteromonas sp. JC3]WMO14012.1 hypothetical protein NI376_18655 [Pseudoalteromonas piscicida]
MATVCVVCPRNDLEAHTIIALAKQYNLHVIQGPAFWGATMADITLQDLPHHIQTLITIELPMSEGWLSYCKQRNIQVIELDHHVYQGADYSNPQSSIEQFAELINHTLNRDEHLIAANDRGFIPELLRVGASFEEVLNIREREATCRGVGTLRNEAQRWLSTYQASTIGSYSLYKAPAKYAPVLLELVQLPTKAQYIHCQQHKQALELPQVCVIYQDEACAEWQIEVAGRVARERFQQLAEQNDNQAVHSWFGGQAPSFFFGMKSEQAMHLEPMLASVKALLR